ncbi:MAG: hypothetical protein RL735_1710 [Pseudomonadota bacterium]
MIPPDLFFCPDERWPALPCQAAAPGSGEKGGRGLDLARFPDKFERMSLELFGFRMADASPKILARLGAGLLRLAKLPFIPVAAIMMWTGLPAQAQLRVGAKAPMFGLEAALAGGSVTFSLQDALKKGPVVVFFYPKSFTGVCTEEANLFAEAMDDFTKAGASVIGISSDTIETQKKFSSMACRDKFAVGADPEMKVIKAYNVGFGMAGAVLPFADRVSYVIAPDGTILSRIKNSAASPHVVQSLAAVRAWKDARR